MIFMEKEPNNCSERVSGKILIENTKYTKHTKIFLFKTKKRFSAFFRVFRCLPS